MGMSAQIVFLRTAAMVIAGLLIMVAGCGENPAMQEEGSEMTYLTRELDGAAGVGGENRAEESKYANMDNWIIFDGGAGGKEADIFVIYPSVPNGTDPQDSPYFRIDSPVMRQTATGWVNRLRGSTSGFGGGYPGLLTSHTNVYAPLYRQANLFSGGGGNMGAIPYDDLAEAFNYYYETINKGERPFIIYGFSQGGYLAIELATRLLRDKPEYNDNHVVTYAPGMAVAQTTINRNPRLSFSQSPNDIGTITSWNSIAPSELARIEAATGFSASYGTLVRNGLVTNPITWLTDDRAVPASENKRSLAGVGLQANYVGARAMNAVNAGGNSFGILLILEREEAGGAPSTSNLGKYHGQDETFFYESIMDNIKVRIDAFKGTSSIKENLREIPQI